MKDLGRRSILGIGVICFSVVGLAGCLATAPSAGGGSSGVSGAAGGGTAVGADNALERCDATLGTVRIDEQSDAGWYSTYHSRYGTGSTVPALRLLIQQSNCFAIVDRNRGLNAGKAERELIRGDEGRAGSNFGTGQIAAADYTLIPEVLVSEQGGTQGKGILSNLPNIFGGKKSTAVQAAGSFSTNEAGTMLTLIDNRSSVQLAAAEGYASNTDLGGMGALFTSGGAGGASAFTKTPQGKVILASFKDAYNKLVVAVRNYKAQTVKGGLGAGGTLGVQGGSTESAREVDAQVKSKKK